MQNHTGINFDTYRAAFPATLEALAHKHGTTLSPIRAATGEAVLEAALECAEARCSGSAGRVHVVSAQCGTGKTTGIAAVVATGMLEFGEFYSAAVVVPTILLAREVQQQIEALTGEYTTTLYSSAHKSLRPDEELHRSIFGCAPDPKRLVPRNSLESARVLIVTHELWRRELRGESNNGVDLYHSFPRTMLFVDEDFEAVDSVEVETEDVQTFKTTLAKLDPHHAAGEILSEVVERMNALSDNATQAYSSNEVRCLVSAEEADVLRKCWCDERKELLNTEHDADRRKVLYKRLDRAAELLWEAASGGAFYSKPDATFWFSRYALEGNRASYVCTSATADLTALVVFRAEVRRHPSPTVNYGRLQLLQVEMPAKFRNFKAVERRQKRKGGAVREYADWIRETVKANTGIGELVLIVAHKDLFLMYGGDGLGEWKSEDPSDPTIWEGRRIVRCFWFAGKGVNKFRDVRKVFQIGEPHMKRTHTISLVQKHDSTFELSDENLRRASATGRRRGDASGPSRDTEFGHLHRNIALIEQKQTGSRGNVRNTGDDGVCGEMALLSTDPLSHLAEARHRIWRGAPKIVPAERPSDEGTDWRAERKRPLAIKLAEYLHAVTDTIAYVHAAQIAVEVGVKPKRLAHNFRLAQEQAGELLAGWKLVTKKEARERYGHMLIDAGKGHVLVRSTAS